MALHNVTHNQPPMANGCLTHIPPSGMEYTCKWTTVVISITMATYMYMHDGNSAHPYQCFHEHATEAASFPVPCPAFHRLQYGKAGRAWYISSCEHDVIDKWKNVDAMFCTLFNHLHVQRLVSMTVVPC